LIFADLQPQDLDGYDVDLWIIALPDGESPRFIDVIPSHKRVIDLSAEYRLNPSWVYGLSETKSSKIASAMRVANPGCYATGMHLSLAPLLHLAPGLEHVGLRATVFGVSGYSGAGTTPSPRNNEGNLWLNSIIPYALVNHKHERETSEHLPFPIDLVFVPHVGNFFRGISLTIVVQPFVCDATSLLSAFRSFYERFPLIRVVEQVPSISEAVRTAKVIIGGFSCDYTQQSIRFVCVLDNLLKGAAAQAIQNMNLMYGLPLGKGLHAVSRSTKVTVLSETAPDHF